MPKQFEHQQNDAQPTNVFHFNTWIGLGLIVCLLISGYLWDNYISPKTIVTTTTTTTKVISIPKISNHHGSSGIKFTKIQDVQVGERAIGTNPEVTDSERSTFLPDPEPATWRKLTLEMIKSDGKRLDITLLRPLNWISESQADIGTTIFLDLPEFGAQGFAKVLNIESCPPIKPGKGNVITGTFHHKAANTIDLYVEGLSKPIGCTDNHPFWSVTRNEFVEAGKLQPDEELHLYSGQTTKVIQILPRPGPEQVHNLEVLNEHVYRVTREGILVHNDCANRKIWKDIEPTANMAPGTVIPYTFGLNLPNGQKVWVKSDATQHMIEYANSKKQNGYSPENVNLISQVQLESFQAAVNKATQGGIPYGQVVNVDGWEIGFGNPPAIPGNSVEIFHALMK